MKDFLKSFDYVLAVAVIGLCVFGILMIYTAGNAPAVHASPGDTVLWRNQRMFVISGVAMMLAFAFIDYRFIARFYLFIYAFMLLLLVLVLIIGGDDGTGTARWFHFYLPGIGWMGMQPSEFAKVFIAIFLAKLLDVKKERFNHILWLAVIFAAVAVPLVLVMEQNALSATMVILFISLVIIFAAGLYYRTILAGLVMLVPVGLFIWLDLQRAYPLFIHRVLEEYQLRRIRTALDPYAAHPDHVLQLEGSLYAIGTGGFAGRGFMENPHIIFGHNDFIFSVVAAQFGFIGAGVVLGVLALIIGKCILIALRAEDMTGRLIAAGVAGMLIFETFVHAGVALGLLPVTGMPLPFMSSGGSMIWGHMMAMGIVLNISLPRKKSLFQRPEELTL
ncbi:MAG: FtsW/RodA/SpoVE family cell cycle protein [Defluviitaleaceae bacterium]|nr:FtsW/RodA/SpoVE family cell cycle protein [Defluviitaleaceae bacterium]MCL2240036.1 FtsW/RodA/SpoVE family cell cycle protein [Defluviitaleaceae bacterium]